MKKLEKYLSEIQEEYLDEIDPLTGAAVAGTAYMIATLSMLILLTFSLIKNLKVDKKWSERMNLILETKNHWIVHIYPELTPNAFALGRGNHIFITTGLLKILSQREVEAVLLHEVHHNKNKDAYKSLAFNFSFFYLVTFIAFSVSTAVSFPLAFMAFILMMKSTNIAHALILGRRQELKADTFTVKYGYGKDLISAFKKLDAEVEKIYRKKGCGKVCQLERKVSNMIDEHPSTQKRIENVLRNIDKINKGSITKIKQFIARKFK